MLARSGLRLGHTECFADVFVLDCCVVLTEFWRFFQAVIDFVLLIGLDSLVVNATLMLSHENVIFFALFFCFNLCVELIKVVSLLFLLLQIYLSFFALSLLVMFGDLVCI